MKKVAVFVIFIVIILACRIFILEPKKNPSGAMAPSVLAGDYLLVYRWPFGHYKLAGYTFGSIKLQADLSSLVRGDIITFKYPKKPSVEFIKRVVAFPGDKITYKEKKLTINGELVADIFIQETDYADKILGTQKVKYYSENIKNKHYRIQLTATKNHIKTEIPNTVTVPEGQYFVLGDNRDLSNDSRHFGFVSAGAITGKVTYVYFSHDQIKQKIRWQRIGMQVQ